MITKNSQGLPTAMSADEDIKKAPVTDEDAMFKQILVKNPDLEEIGRTSFHWVIKDFDNLPDKTHSPSFELDGYSWRILLFPRGNNQKKSMSVYLEVISPELDNWHVCGQFALVISNPRNASVYFANNANHRFSADEVDWGFTRFYEIDELSQVYRGAGPFLENNSITLSAFLRTIKDETGILWHNFNNYDSRKETGYAGIRNQGATCYMNSLLQSLYFTNEFRKAVYQIPTEHEEPHKSIALALQRIFYNLQYSPTPVGTIELTKSFGWDSVESFTQHDVQEFNRVLQDNLEEKMKGTPADGAISKLFKGKMKSYIKCIDVDYESSRSEDYYDIQLNVKGCKNLEESFREYIQVETLEGDNKYMAEGHGLQDAKKGVVFESFPPVLNLQLKRFDYDFMQDAMVKINDRHEFPAEINLDEFCIVHSGDISSGHYFALLRPEIEEKWYRFDDDRVIPVTKKDAFEENFGDETIKDNNNPSAPPPFLGARENSAQALKRFTNAYMLVYIRKSKLDEILAPVENTDIPPHLKKRLDDEKALIEKRIKDQQEMQLNVKVAVVTDDSFNNYQGFNLGLIDDKMQEVSPGIEIFKALKTEKVSAFKQQLAEHYKIEPDRFRLWTLTYRHNNALLRVDKPLQSAEERVSVDKIKEYTSLPNSAKKMAKFFMEIAEKDKPLPVLKNDQVLVFLKYFDVKEQTLRGLGHVFISYNDRLSTLMPTLMKMSDSSKHVLLYKEEAPNVQLLKGDQQFRKFDIQNGDIICLQSKLSQKETENLNRNGLIASAPDYYRHLYHQAVVSFEPIDAKRKGVQLKLDRTLPYSAVAARLASELNVEAGKIRLMTDTDTPAHLVQYKPDTKLEEMVPDLPVPEDYMQHNQFERVHMPTLYYEVLDINVADLESKRSIDVTVVGPTLRQGTKVTALVSRVGTVQQLLEMIVAKTKLDIKDPSLIRLFEVENGLVTKEFSPDQTVDSVATEEDAMVYAEPIPADELEMNVDTDRLIQVVHYHNKPNKRYGIPFRFVAIKGEPFEQTKKRLQKRTGLGDMDWKNVKFTILRNIFAPEPITTPIETDDFDLRKARLFEEDALGLDHVDKSTSRSASVFDRGISIRG
ncbi:cysteine proteinase [Backusella circina FSU 941]|nr:cysteine proteinase [Backusella circina FSU 941]